MSSEAVVCPHCGARRSDRDPMKELSPADRALRAAAESREKKLVHVSPDEAKALTQLGAAPVTGAIDPNSRTGFAAWLVFPQTIGRLRSWEVALTVVAFPLIGLAIASVGWLTVRYRALSMSGRGLGWASVPLAALSAAVVLIGFGVSPWIAAVAAGFPLSAWLVRGVLRMRSRRM